MFRFFFCLLLIVYASTASAFDIEVNQLRYNLDVESSSISFCGVAPSYSLSSLIIPDSVLYNGRWLPVVAIEKNAFPNGYKPVTSVIIPSSVQELKPGAFPYACPLVNIKIADSSSPLKVGYAQEGPLLTTGQKEGDGTFHLCRKLESVYIGRNLDYDGFDSLKYGFGPFFRSVVKSVVFGDSVSMIQKNMFWDAPNLNNLSISRSISYIGESAFYFSPIKSPFIVPDSMSVIEPGVFASSDLSLIDLGSDHLIEIGASAFKGSEKSSSKKNLILGPNVRFIGKNAFANQKGISHIFCYSSIPPVIDAEVSTEFMPSSVYADAVLHIPSGSAKSYAEANIWKLFWNVEELPDSAVDMSVRDSSCYIISIFDIEGKKRQSLSSGINIVVYSNGRIERILMK